jgi:hypothetical protein
MIKAGMELLKLVGLLRAMITPRPWIWDIRANLLEVRRLRDTRCLGYHFHQQLYQWELRWQHKWVQCH